MLQNTGRKPVAPPCRMRYCHVRATARIVLTHDDVQWAQWRHLNPDAWHPTRGYSWADLMRWVLAQRRTVVLDARLPGMPTPDSPEWQSAARAADVLVVDPNAGSSTDGRHFLVAGAKGFARGDTSLQALSSALTVVAEGGVWLGVSSIAKLLNPNPTVGSTNVAAQRVWCTGLTRREKEVAASVAQGLSNKTIAEQLGISERTVRAHVSAVFEKFRVSDRLTLALIVHGVSAPPSKDG